MGGDLALGFGGQKKLVCKRFQKFFQENFGTTVFRTKFTFCPQKFQMTFHFVVEAVLRRLKCASDANNYNRMLIM